MGIKGLTSWLKDRNQQDIRLIARSFALKKARKVLKTDESRKSHCVRVFSGHTPVEPRRLPHSSWLTDTGNVAVVDCGALIFSILYTNNGTNLWYDFEQLVANLRRFLRALTSCGLRVVILADGVSDWISSGKSAEKFKRVSKSVATMKSNCAALNAFADGKLKRKAAIRKCDVGKAFTGLHAWVKTIIRYECRVLTEDTSIDVRADFIECTQECDTAIAHFCEEHSGEVFGVFSCDSDMYVFDLDAPVFALNTFRFDTTFRKRGHEEVKCEWQCGMTFACDIWCKLDLATIWHRLCFAKLKGNDICDMQVFEVWEAAECAREIADKAGDSEAELRRFVGSKLEAFYTPKPIVKSRNPKLDGWIKYGVNYLSVANQNWDLAESGNSVQALLAPARAARYCSKDCEALGDEIQEWAFDEADFGDTHRSAETTTTHCAATAKKKGFCKKRIDIKSIRHRCFALRKTSKEKQLGSTAAGDLHSAMDALRLEASECQWQLSDMKLLIAEALTEMKAHVDVSQFCTQIRAMRLQLEVRTRFGSELKEFVRKSLPHATDIHFQYAFLHFLRLFVFALPLPPIHLLFSGRHYHFVCHSLREDESESLVS